jgi:NADPH2:quinone reductase
MKAIRLQRYGDPDVLQLEDVPEPVPAAGQVRVAVRAIGVNPYETYIRSGTYANKPPLPTILGQDAAGIIDAVGDNVMRWKSGDRVYTSRCLTGAYAQKTVCDARFVHELPDHVSFEQGAAVNVPYATAYRALFHRAAARPGETVLIHGASGGVGIAAVQFAVAGGCRVIGSAGTEQGLALVKEHGAALVVNHREPGYEKQIDEFTSGAGVHVIIEMLANVNLDRDLALLASRGRVVVVGNRGRTEIDARQTMGKESAILGMQLWAGGDDAVLEAHHAIVSGLRNGALRPVVGSRLAISEAARAHRQIMEAPSYGKIVLIP